jgi:AhpC/TSA family
MATMVDAAVGNDLFTALILNIGWARDFIRIQPRKLALGSVGSYATERNGGTMAATLSQMLPLGTELPDFTLGDVVTGQPFGSSRLAGKPAVIAFICNHCPYVKHIRAELAAFGRFCAERKVGMVAVSSNYVGTHPQDGPLPMADEARQNGYAFPYLFDEDQSVALRFHAACTPDFYLFDAAGKLVYRGQFDDSRPGNGKPVTGHDLRQALDAVLANRQPSPDQKPSIGCNIKWRPGVEPTGS